MLHALRLRRTKLKVTKQRYCKLLSVVGRSHNPLSAYEIMNDLNPLRKLSPPRHAYRMVMSLSGVETIVNGGKRYRYRGGPKYLNITLKPKNLNRIVELEKERNKDFHQILDRNLGNRILSSYGPLSYEDEQAIDEVEKICSVTGNYRYSLSIRGLLLLLYGESRSKITEGKKERIRKVLDSPATLDVAPFLLDWRDFEQAGFDVTKTLENIAEQHNYYITDEKTDNESLLLKVTERYLNEVSGYFYLYETVGILADKVRRRNKEYFRKYIELDIPNRLVKYRARMLNIKRELLSRELALVDQHINDTQ